MTYRALAICGIVVKNAVAAVVDRKARRELLVVVLWLVFFGLGAARPLTDVNPRIRTHIIERRLLDGDAMIAVVVNLVLLHQRTAPDMLQGSVSW